MSAGRLLEEMLADTDLIDVGYIVRLVEGGGIVPRWQDTPDAAKITPRTVWRLKANVLCRLPVIVLSYPWLDQVSDATSTPLRARNRSKSPYCELRAATWLV